MLIAIRVPVFFGKFIYSHSPGDLPVPDVDKKCWTRTPVHLSLTPSPCFDQIDETKLGQDALLLIVQRVWLFNFSEYLLWDIVSLVEALDWVFT
jgi:hypothetical protein